MKTKLTRFSKSAVSIVLSTVMLLSVMLVNAETVGVQSGSEDKTVSNNAVTVDITPDDVTQTILNVEDVQSVSEEDSAADESVKNDEEKSQLDAAEVKTEDVKADTAVQANSKKSEVKKAPEASGATVFSAGTTVYFIRSLTTGATGNGWINIYCYSYTDGYLPMKIVEGTTNLYSCTLTSGTEGIIFRGTNNDSSWSAGNATANITSTSGGNVFYIGSEIGNDNRYKCIETSFSALGINSSYISAYSGSSTDYDYTVLNSTKTLYFDASDYDWSNHNAYSWFSNDDVEIRNYNWPGNTNMTEESNDVYSVDVPLMATYIIFNNGSGTQTVDLTIPKNDNNLFTPNGLDNGKIKGEWFEYTIGDETTVKTRTVYFADNADWSYSNENKTNDTGYEIYAYCWKSSTGENNATWPGEVMSQDAQYNGLYSYTTTEKYDKVRFFCYRGDHTEVSTSNAGFTFANGQVYDNSGPLSLTPAEAAYSPDDSKLNSDNTETGYYIYWANQDDSVLEANSDDDYNLKNTKTPREVYKVTDTNGTNWYYAEFTASEMSTNFYFALGDSNKKAVNLGDNVVVKLSNNMILGSRRANRRSSLYFGETWTLKKLDKVRIYVNSIGSDFYRYTVVPYSKYAEGCVNVVAKDGTIRSGGYMKYAQLADTKITAVDGVDRADGSYTIQTDSYTVSIEDDYNIDGANRAETALIKKGSTLKVTTTIKDESDDKNEELRKKYYVKAFNINGETIFPTTTGVQKSGVYECEYTIPSDYTGENIEITPVYFYDESFGSRTYITFIVDDFKDEVEEQWGKKVDGTDGTAILSCYAWYGENQDTLGAKAKNKPALGGYPGQPMVYENGHYIMQVPTTNDADTPAHIQGITLNNYVWDFVHCDLQGAGNDGQRESINCQTYDYDDFVVLSYADPTPEFIAFRFKYRTTKYPYTGTATTKRDYGNEPSGETTTLTYSNYATGTGTGNGWDYPYTDYYNNTIDLFNHILNTTQTSNSHFYVVSDGYQELYYGHFTTIWYVYDDEYNYVGKIPSSAFYYFNDTYMKSLEECGEAPTWFMEHATQSNTTVSLSDQKQEYWETYYKLYKGTDTTNSALYHPVEVTYETAIRAQDINVTNSHPRDPALRNDGNWHYSRSDVTFGATIEIQYSTVASPTVFNNTDNFVTTNDDDETLDKPYAGSATGAHAYFTNKTYTPYGDTKAIDADFYQDYTATNVKTSRDSFTFEADQSSTGEDGTIYVFKGWYLKNSDNTETLLTTTKTVNSKMASTADMRSETTLIAKYAPLGDALVITHDLYKNAEKYTKSPAVLNGTGTPTVSVKVYDKTNEKEIDIPYVELSDNQLAIDKDTLAEYNSSDYQLIVTLDVESDSDNTYVTTYLKTLAENATAGTDANGYYYEYTEENVTGPATAGTWNATKTEDTADGNDQVVYKTDVSGLFNTDTTLKTNYIKFYSQLSSTKINILFKYYDREMADNSQPTNINKTASEFTTTQSISSGNDAQDKLDNAVGSGVAELNEANRVDNVIDQYFFWASQSQVTDENNGLKSLPRTARDYSGADLTYHTDYYGRVSTDANYLKEALALVTDDEKTALKTEKWVTYKNANDKEITSITSDNLNQVATVVVWGFNYPKTYYMDFADQGISESATDNIYFAQSTKTEYANIPFYYNQRVGKLDKNDLIDKVSPHLDEYGISQSDDATKVRAEDKDGYVFDGWYEKINDQYVKVSSDQTYGNRVTKGAALIAGYRLKTVSEKKGITVTKNDTEKYVDSNNVDRVRYVTVLNAYGFGDSDNNFKSVSVVYVKLPTTLDAEDSNITINTLLSDTDFTDNLQKALDRSRDDGERDLDKATVTVEVNDVEITSNTISYTYDIVTTYTDVGTSNESITSGNQIKFTNKNRAQFVLDLKATTVAEGASSSNLLVFTEVKYKDDNVKKDSLIAAYKEKYDTTDDPNEEALAEYLNNYLTSTYGTAVSADTTNGYVYIASDNYVVYDNNTHTTQQ